MVITQTPPQQVIPGITMLGEVAVILKDKVNQTVSPSVVYECYIKIGDKNMGKLIIKVHMFSYMYIRICKLLQQIWNSSVST
jgi:hypothetical protein